MIIISLMLLVIFFLSYQLLVTSKRLIYALKLLNVFIESYNSTIRFFSSLDTEKGKLSAQEDCVKLFKELNNVKIEITEITEKYGAK